MKKIFKVIINNIYCFVFIFLIGYFGLFSFKNIFNFYVNDGINNNDSHNDTGSKFENDYLSNFQNKLEFINLNGYIRNKLNIREMNNVVKLDNNYLVTPFRKVDDEKLFEYSNMVSKLDNYLKEKNTEFLYISTPYVSDKYDNKLPVGIEDYGNKNIDTFLTYLDKRNVKYLDLREEIHNDSKTTYDYFYKTDHHWTTVGALELFSKISNFISSNYDITMSEWVNDKSNYKIVKYPKWHLGSNGQRCGLYYGEIDDFDLVIPNYKTSISRDGVNYDSLENLLFDLEPLNNVNYSSRYTYDYVLDKALGDYKNKEENNNKKLLVVADSMGKAMNQYFIVNFSEVKTIDAYNPSNLKSVINSYNPDMVIMMHYPSLLEYDVVFDFGL